ncbi:transglycosylase domain-containing protein [Microseira sp. BLCC-F43]|uniref:transglycosylase domain-containing protein n=1 Tax=Microseira sp. BLCC-F43 TaxID=3153602 RepID=UPI0035B75AAA
MTKFIPELNDISTQFSNSKAAESATTSDTKSQSANGVTTLLQLESAVRETDAAPDDASTATTKPKSKLMAAMSRVIPQQVLDSPLLDLKNPMYRSRKFWILTGIGVSVSGGALAVGVTWWNLDRSLPDPLEALTFVRDGTLTIKAEDGTILQQRGEATREKYSLEEMPPHLVQAFIASEDRRFYQHKGVDYQGILRAVVSNLTARDVVEGGSTITQQLARIVFLSQERSVWRKIREIMLAQKIEQKLTKQQILERYLNLVYLGEGAYGVADAAWVYFSKDLDELTLSEMATLVAMAPAPGKFSPLVDEKAAVARRNLVLQRMQEAKIITPQLAQATIAEPLEIEPAPPKRLATEAPYFTSYVEQELPRLIPPEAVEAGGLIVETSLNREWQQQAEEVVEKAIDRYGRSERFKQAALVALDPRNGEVKAMVGGTDFDDTQFNRVTQAMRQPGSTFKGFVYTTAIAAGFSPFRGYLDAPFKVDGYTPKNYSETHSGWISMRDALVKSVNTVAVRALIDVGFEPTIETAHKMGIKSELKPVYSLALGGVEVNLLELTGGYGTLAAKGKHTEVHGIRRVLDQRGEVLYEAKYQPYEAVDEETAAIMTWMLRGVVNSGTGSAASLPGRQVAGKTGTSDDARDLWFIGYIPQLVTGVWLGNDDNTPTWGASSTAALTWRNFMVKAVDGMEVEKFPPRPDKVEGRKGIIKAEPVRPGQLYTMRIKRASNDNDDDSRRSRRWRGSDNDSSPSQGVRRRFRVRSENQTASNDDQPTVVRRRRRVFVASSSDSSSSDNSRQWRRRRSYTASSSNTRASEQPRVSRRRSYTASSSNTRSSDTSSYTRRRSSSGGSRRSGSGGESTASRRSFRSSARVASRRSRPAAARSAAPAPAASAPTIDFKSHH